MSTSSSSRTSEEKKEHEEEQEHDEHEEEVALRCCGRDLEAWPSRRCGAGAGEAKRRAQARHRVTRRLVLTACGVETLLHRDRQRGEYFKLFAGKRDRGTIARPRTPMRNGNANGTV